MTDGKGVIGELLTVSVGCWTKARFVNAPGATVKLELGLVTVPSLATRFVVSAL
jgi:hypothetical protein